MCTEPEPVLTCSLCPLSLSDNACEVTRALYLRILSSLLGQATLSQHTTPAVSLPSDSLSWLHTLLSLSRKVCTDISSGIASPASVREASLSEHVKLMTWTALHSCVAPPVASVAVLGVSEGARTLVGVLRRSQDARLCGSVLEGLGSLREQWGRSMGSPGRTEGEGEEAWEEAEESLRAVLSRYVTETADDDLLIQVRGVQVIHTRCPSSPSFRLMATLSRGEDQQLNSSVRYSCHTLSSIVSSRTCLCAVYFQVVSKAYHLFLQSHCR